MGVIYSLFRCHGAEQNVVFCTGYLVENIVEAKLMPNLNVTGKLKILMPNWENNANKNAKRQTKNSLLGAFKKFHI